MAHIAQFERLYSAYRQAQQAYEDAVYSILDCNDGLRGALAVLAGECASTHKAWINEGARLAIDLLPLEDTSRCANLPPEQHLRQ